MNLRSAYHKNPQTAFTLVEIMIAVAIFALIAAIAMPHYGRARTQAARTVCIGKQRNLYTAVDMYELNESSSLNNISGRANRLNELYVKGYVRSQSAFECPSSSTKDYSDYDIIFTDDGYLSDIECVVNPADHRWP